MRRSVVAITGVAVVAAYAAAAAWSGHLSPLARRPILDGLAPPTPYRWVEPPPELAAENVAPTPESFRVALGADGSETAVLTTGDAQVTLILPEGAFDAAAGQRFVGVRIEPLGASDVAPPPAPRTILGNVYRIQATYRPSGDRADIGGQTRVVLVYPALAGDHGGHEVLLSRGGTWAALVTNDLPSIQQADAAIASLGDVAVGGRISPVAAPTGGGDGDGSPVGVIVLVGALVVLAVAAAALLLLPRGGPSRPARGAGTGSRRGPSRSG